MSHRIQGAMWISLYILIGLLPLGLALINLDPGRGFWINFSVALGFVGLSMLGLQFALAARSRWVTDPLWAKKRRRSIRGSTRKVVFRRG